jgi:deazaflavin-dependent oxidoreductase (nitroreductase family)
MAGSVRDRVIYPLEKRVINPAVMLAWRLGIPPPGDALLETTGRRTGQPRHTPVCDGLDRDTFWLVAQRGREADWVRNIQANPRVRVRVRSESGLGWRPGTAHILDADDPRERQRLIGRGDLMRRLCVCASGAMAKSPLTVRIDLDTS